jgi:hypothetical protein
VNGVGDLIPSLRLSAVSDGPFPRREAGDVYRVRMRIRASLLLASVLALALTGCATAPTGAGAASTAPPPSAVPSPSPSESASSVVASGSTDARAQEQARAWLAEATLPPGAVPATPADLKPFSSFTGWPCGPYAQLTAYWKIPGMGVTEAGNWLREHPTGDLISTAGGPWPDNPDVTSTAVGHIPAQGAQEGIVYTVDALPDGVEVRAEVAAQTTTASCPPLPDGGQYGAPGQG